MQQIEKFKRIEEKTQKKQQSLSLASSNSLFKKMENRIASTKLTPEMVEHGLTATVEAMFLPKTKIPVIDAYYSNVDTQGQIDKIKFKAEFERLQTRIEKYWHAKHTPESETHKIRDKFLPMLQ